MKNVLFFFKFVVGKFQLSGDKMIYFDQRILNYFINECWRNDEVICREVVSI